MSRPIWQLPDRYGSRRAEVTLWICAGLLALIVHVGTVAWLLRKAPVMPAANERTAAIMIELADIASATQTETEQISPDQAESEESTPVEEVIEEPPEAVEDSPDQPEPPKEDVIEHAPDPPEPVIRPQPDWVAAPLPIAPPQPQMQAAQQHPQPSQAAAQAMFQAKARLQQAARTAAAQTSSGAPSPAQIADWQSRLMAHLERRKRYPAGARSRRERGIVHVRFTIGEDGQVLAANLARSSGYADLDNEVLSLLRRASPVPAPPPGFSRNIIAPVKFDVK